MKAYWRVIGIGMAEPDAPRRPHIKYLFHSAHLSPWSTRFRFGYVLGWNGPYWHNAIGIKGKDWDGGNWLGGMSWKQGWGPFAVCRWRRRGSLRSARQFARNMDCTCPRTGLFWPLGFYHQGGCPLEEPHEDGTPWF